MNHWLPRLARDVFSDFLKKRPERPGICCIIWTN
jgi:hypothetical protein